MDALLARSGGGGAANGRPSALQRPARRTLRPVGLKPSGPSLPPDEAVGASVIAAAGCFTSSCFSSPWRGRRGPPRCFTYLQPRSGEQEAPRWPPRPPCALGPAVHWRLQRAAAAVGCLNVIWQWQRARCAGGAGHRAGPARSRAGSRARTTHASPRTRAFCHPAALRRPAHNC